MYSTQSMHIWQYMLVHGTISCHFILKGQGPAAVPEISFDGQKWPAQDRDGNPEKSDGKPEKSARTRKIA